MTRLIFLIYIWHDTWFLHLYSIKKIKCVLYVHIKRVLKISYETSVMHASLYYSIILPVNINYISLLICPWTNIFPWTSKYFFYFHLDEYQYIVNFTIKMIKKVKICKVQKSFTLQNHGGDSKIVWCAHNLNRIFKIRIKIKKNWNWIS